jgi:hypothetical protein
MKTDKYVVIEVGADAADGDRITVKDVREWLAAIDAEGLEDTVLLDLWSMLSVTYKYNNKEGE